MADGEEEGSKTRWSFATWWEQLLADHAHEKVCSIIRVRQYELASLIGHANAERLHCDPSELRGRTDQAGALAAEKVPGDHAAANELLDKLDGVMPLVVEDDRLRLMLEAELQRGEASLPESARERAQGVLGSPAIDDAGRRQMEALLTAAAREQNDRRREERVASDLRRNYLTWLGTVLVLLLAGVALTTSFAASSGLWSDVLLALLSGALGGTLSGVIRLRVPENRLAALRNLGLVMLVQPVVGGVGGLILFAVWRSGLLTVKGLSSNDWAAVAVVAFAGGFSERVFLRSLAPIGASDRTDGSRHVAAD